MREWREWAISGSVASASVLVLAVVGYALAFAVTSVTDRVSDVSASLRATGSAGL